MKTIKNLFYGIVAVLAFMTVATAQNDTIDEARIEEPVESQAEESVIEEQVSETESFNSADLKDAIVALGERRNWDTDGDGAFNSAEFYVTVYQIWDINHDSKLDKDEWQTAVERYAGDYDIEQSGDFTRWDRDGNDEVSINEFARALERTHLYASGYTGGEQGMMSQRSTQQVQQSGEQSDTGAGGLDGEISQDPESSQDRQMSGESDDRLSETARGQDPAIPMAAETDAEQQGNESASMRGEQDQPRESIEIWDEDDDGVIEKISAGDWSRRFDKDDN